MMDVYLNTELPPYGLGLLLSRFRELGLAGVRVGVAHDGGNLTNRAIDELRDSGLKVIWLVAGGKMTKGSPSKLHHPPWEPDELVEHCSLVGRMLQEKDLQLVSAVEVGNEPDLAHDLWKKHPEALATTFNHCAKAIWSHAPHVRVLTPSVSNLNGRGFRYLKRMLGTGVILRADLAFHRYPHGHPPRALIPHEGFASREGELAELRRLTPGRTLWLTETGFSEGPYVERLAFWRKRLHRLSPEDVSRETLSDLEWWSRWSRADLQAYVAYGLNSGPDLNDREQGYGWRGWNEAWDGEWKPVAHTVAGFLRENQPDPSAARRSGRG